MLWDGSMQALQAEGPAHHASFLSQFAIATQQHSGGAASSQTLSHVMHTCAPAVTAVRRCCLLSAGSGCDVGVHILPCLSTHIRPSLT